MTLPLVGTTLMECYSGVEKTALFDLGDDGSSLEDIKFSKEKFGESWRHTIEVGEERYMIVLTPKSDPHPTENKNIPYTDVSFRLLGSTHAFEDLSENRPVTDIVSLLSKVVSTAVAFFHENKRSKELGLYVNRFSFNAFTEDVYYERSPRVNIYEKMLHRFIPRLFPSWYYSIEENPSWWKFDVWSPLYAHTFNYWD